jgi:hypothetical protein
MQSKALLRHEPTKNRRERKRKDSKEIDGEMITTSLNLRKGEI